jgi:hypothetical protein
MDRSKHPYDPPSFLKSDIDRLGYLEDVCRNHGGSFIKFGFAVRQIRDERLYRCTHRTFKTFCRERLNLSSSRVYQLISSAEIATEIGYAARPPRYLGQVVTTHRFGLDDIFDRCMADPIITAAKPPGGK